MTDVFISYSREDRPRIEKLAAALETEGFDVWWDSRLAGGTEFSKETEAKLNEAKLVLVAWSKVSVDSHWVADEATVGRDKGNLIPIAIDDVQPKIGFRQFQTIEFDGWKGDPASDDFQHLASVVRARLSGEAPPPVQPAVRRKLAGGVPPSVWITAVVAAAIVAIVLIGTFGPDDRPPKSVPDAAEEVLVAGAGSAPAARQDSAIATENKASIAVLPFADLSPDGDQGYFSDGMAEELLNVLARVDGLKVASRTSSFQYKNIGDKSAPEIASELDVRHVLEGSVRKSGEMLRITAQLIDAQTDAHLWSETFDRPLSAENVFAIQDEIALAIVSELLGAMSLSAPSVATTTDISAYELYLKALSYFQGRTDLDLADDFLAQATEIDPGFAKAWALRAAVQQVLPDYGYSDLSYEALNGLTQEYADRALALDPNNARAIASVAGMKLRIAELALGREDIGVWLGDLEKSIVLDPSDSSAVNWIGLTYSLVGEQEKALETYRQCTEMDPFFAPCTDNTYDTLYALGRYDEARTVFQSALDRGVATGNWANFSMLAHFNERTAFLMNVNRTKWLAGWRRNNELFDAFRDRGEGHEELIEDLRAHLRDRETPHLPFLSTLVIPIGVYEVVPFPLYMWGEDYIAYRRSPEFKAYVRNASVYDYWRKHGFPPQCRPVGAEDFECE